MLKSKMTPDSLDYPKVVSRENRASKRRRIEFKKAADKKTVNQPVRLRRLFILQDQFV
jgi:hypothetical protein